MHLWHQIEKFKFTQETRKILWEAARGVLPVAQTVQGRYLRHQKGGTPLAWVGTPDQGKNPVAKVGTPCQGRYPPPAKVDISPSSRVGTPCGQTDRQTDRDMSNYYLRP